MYTLFNSRNWKLQKQIWFFIIAIGIYIPIHVINMMLSEDTYASKTVENSNFINKRNLKFHEEFGNRIVKSGSDGNSLHVNNPEFTVAEYLTSDEKPPPPFNVDFVIRNENFCRNSIGLKYLIYIHTSPKNKEKRENIRQTWANKNLYIDRRTSVVFMMGIDDHWTKDVKEEAEMYGDIVQGDFLDSYHNLSIKGVIALKWIHLYCKDIQFAIKADDDAFVNIFRILSIIKAEQDKEIAKKLVVCPLWPNNSMPILRDPKKCLKWCIKDTEFPGRKRYPRYCAGISFAISRDMVEEAYNASFSTPFFWVDDVYISGLLFGKVKNVRYLSTGKHFRADANFSFKHYANMSIPLNIYYTHVRKGNMFSWIWQYALQRLTPQELSQLEPRVYSTFIKDPLKVKHEPVKVKHKRKIK